jgi:hypothetical protein
MVGDGDNDGVIPLGSRFNLRNANTTDKSKQLKTLNYLPRNTRPTTHKNWHNFITLIMKG